MDTTTHPEIDKIFWEYFDNKMTDIIEPINISASHDVTISAPEQGFVVGIYSALLVIGALGNVAVFTSLVKSRRRKSRVNLLMTHLAVADLLVTFIVIPLEIGWKTTNAWLAGNLACKVFLVLRAFGLYLSSNVLVCISLDRFFAVLYPLRLPIARKRSKMMLTFAWIIALVCSLPQSMIFRVLTHPKDPEFRQCVSFDAFENQRQELAYNVFCLCAMYFVPLLVITVCYLCIFYEISKSSKEISDKTSSVSVNSRVLLRRSDQRPLARARRRTLRMTVTIVTVFACCWLPYATMTLWYMLDRESAQHVSQRVQDLFFIMAVSNSCMDPLVYGSYALDVRSIVARAMGKILCMHHRSPVTTMSAPGTIKTKVGGPASSHVNGTKARIQRYGVRFQETSLAGPSACSDPSPCWTERLSHHAAPALRQSRSCEVFTMEGSRKKAVCLHNEL